MRKFFKALLAVALFAALPFAASPAALAQEVIRSMASDITLARDGSVHVLETITVHAAGVKIRHGIYRDIPTVMINPDGSRLYSSLTINGIKRDGKAEPYHTEGIQNGERIYLGDADIVLSPGIYQYTIDYTMTRIGRRFADHDELYWNATGNYWDFPIESAVARVTLPKGAVISDLQGYTGPFGSNEQAVTIQKVSDNQAVFRATRVFNPYEGMTVSASFQPGILTAPTGTQGALDFVSDHRAELLPGIGVIIILAYNLLAWMRVGRDPPKGTVIPLFHPPEGFSPALTHYIHRWGWRRSGWIAFTAGMVDLAVKGLVSFHKENKKNTIVTTSTDPKTVELPPEEARLISYFASKGKVTINKKNGPDLNRWRSAFLDAAAGGDKKTWFRYNFGFVFVSFALSIILLILMVVFDVIDPFVVFIAVFAAIFLTVFGTVFGSVLNSGWVARVFLIFWVGFFVMNIGSGFVSMASNILDATSLNPAVLALITLVLINALFGILMRAPTVEGRKVMDKIDGFKMYLETAEKERLNFVGEPGMTVSRFESILPYAIALGVEKPWTERFEADLARNAVRDYDGTGYHPMWNSGSDFRSGSMSRDVAAFASGMSAAMIASQPSSSSSSGGGGGGSSGGGGGGGGGGGW